MNLGLDKAKVARYKAQITKLVGDPVRMRLAIVFTVTALGVGAIYYPLSGRIDQERAAVESEQKRLAAIEEVEALRRDTKEFRARIDKQSDTNEWVQYLLAGSRQAGARLRGMETREPRKVGPYMAVALIMELQGNYAQLRGFVEWLEQSDRLLRIETVRIDKIPGFVVMRIQVLGLVQKHA
jgi:Tfp pilus assembly protein PilO